ncbi:hypothetical protein ACFWGN_15145 [Oerskovia sp. NPDC060338]|uniref:Uncharacterized protein n=1 Tax=Oerskovia enterophila TaxID=43678 RepID=A0ABX2Y8T6_9CELL|nr:hypothetical protein [Oerskovia enterophila]OCI32851.1 hypothetical protein OERS_04430 [Oerskovia enterophila]
MSTQTFDDQAHPRATDGKFATKDVSEAPGGLSALNLAPEPAGPLAEARTDAIERAIADGRLSPAARDMTARNLVYMHAEAAHDGSELAALADLGIPALATVRESFTPCSPGDHGDDVELADECESGEHLSMLDTDVVIELDFPDDQDEVVSLIERTGARFSASGAEWASDPDGSRTVDYATGKRESVSVHLYGMDEDTASIVDRVG